MIVLAWTLSQCKNGYTEIIFPICVTCKCIPETSKDATCCLVNPLDWSPQLEFHFLEFVCVAQGKEGVRNAKLHGESCMRCRVVSHYCGGHGWMSSSSPCQVAHCVLIQLGCQCWNHIQIFRIIFKWMTKIYNWWKMLVMQKQLSSLPSPSTMDGTRDNQYQFA